VCKKELENEGKDEVCDVDGIKINVNKQAGIDMGNIYF
jgi:hypothetical protein